MDLKEAFKQTIDLQRKVSDRLLQSEARQLIKTMALPMSLLASLDSEAKVKPETIEKIVLSAVCLLITEGHLILKEKM